MEDQKKEIRSIIERFENGLFRAGITTGDIDYDILSEVRMECWHSLENLITKQ